MHGHSLKHKNSPVKRRTTENYLVICNYDTKINTDNNKLDSTVSQTLVGIVVKLDDTAQLL